MSAWQDRNSWFKVPDRTISKPAAKPTAKPSMSSKPVTPTWAADPPTDSSHWFTKVRVNPKPPDVAGKPIVLIIGGAVVIVYIARLASSPGDVLRAPGQMVKIALGGAFTVVLLLLIAEVHGEVAEQLAWLILAYVIVHYGAPVFGNVNKLFKQPYTVVSTPPANAPKKTPVPPNGGIVPGMQWDQQSGRYVQGGI